MTSNHTSNNNNDNSNIISDIPNYDFKTVCSKEQVLLKREKSCNIFLLQFNLETKSTDLHDIINIGMYNLLFNLNKENIEKIEIKKWISHVDIILNMAEEWECQPTVLAGELNKMLILEKLQTMMAAGQVMCLLLIDILQMTKQ